MNDKLGVVEAFARSVARPVSPVSAAAGIAPLGRPQRDHVLVAVGLVVDHRLEVDERVVAGGVAVACDRFLGFVLGLRVAGCPQAAASRSGSLPMSSCRPST